MPHSVVPADSIQELGWVARDVGVSLDFTMSMWGSWLLALSLLSFYSYKYFMRGYLD